METVICGTSMTSAFNVVLNLVCIWLLLIVMADLRKIREGTVRPAGPRLSP